MPESSRTGPGAPGAEENQPCRQRRPPRATTPGRDDDDASLTSRLGPGLITGAADDDPSGIATYSQAGAQFRFALVWTLFLTTPLMIGIQMLSARIGFVTRNGLATNMDRICPRWLTVSLIGLLVVANTVNIAADVAAMAEAVKLLVGGPQPLYVLAIGAVCIAMQVFFSYERTVRVLKWLTLALFAYVAVVLAVAVPWRRALDESARPWAFLPTGTTAKDYAAMVVAVLGTTISPYLFFWQATQEVEDCRRRPESKEPAPPPGLRAQAPAADQARHGRRHGLFEPRRAVHRRRHRGDAEPARHRQHPDLGTGGRGAAADRRRTSRS